MKRLLTLATTLAMVALFAMPAQAQEKNSTRFGLQGGITVSNISGDDVPDGSTSSKTGFYAGVYFNYFFAQNWSVALDANWLAGVGAKQSDGDAETKLSYLEFPLTLNFAFPLGQSEKTWLGLGAGISAGINLTCKATSGTAGSSEFDCKDQTESINWSVPFQGGLGFRMADNAVVWLGARYQLGLSSIDKDFDSVKLNYWEFTAGVGFDI